MRMKMVHAGLETVNYAMGHALQAEHDLSREDVRTASHTRAIHKIEEQ